MTAMHSLEMTTQCSDQTFIRTGISFSMSGNTLDISEGKQKEFSFVLVLGMQGWRSEILLEATSSKLENNCRKRSGFCVC